RSSFGDDLREAFSDVHRAGDRAADDDRIHSLRPHFFQLTSLPNAALGDDLRIGEALDELAYELDVGEDCALGVRGIAAQRGADIIEAEFDGVCRLVEVAAIRHDLDVGRLLADILDELFE